MVTTLGEVIVVVPPNVSGIVPVPAMDWSAVIKEVSPVPVLNVVAPLLTVIPAAKLVVGAVPVAPERSNTPPEFTVIAPVNVLAP